MAPLSSNCLAFSISAVAPPRRRTYLLVVLGTPGPDSVDLALRHPVVLRDQVDENAEERQSDREMSQPVFPKPERSSRRKMSPITLNSNMNHAIQMKMTRIVQKTSRKG